MTITVSTKDELKKAKEDKVEKIIVVGKLAKDLYATRKIATLSTTSLAVLTTAIGAGVALAPATGGVSAGASLATAAATTGVSIPAIIFASTIGVGVIIAIFKDYNVKIKGEPTSSVFSLELERKEKKEV